MAEMSQDALKHEPVISTNIASVGYDPATKTLEVKYRGSGKTYSFAAVGYDQHFKLMNAKSKGRFVANVLEKNHKATLVR